MNPINPSHHPRKSSQSPSTQRNVRCRQRRSNGTNLSGPNSAGLNPKQASKTAPSEMDAACRMHEKKSASARASCLPPYRPRRSDSFRIFIRLSGADLLIVMSHNFGTSVGGGRTRSNGGSIVGVYGPLTSLGEGIDRGIRSG